MQATMDLPRQATDFVFTRGIFDVSMGEMVDFRALPVQDDMDFLGGIGRSFKVMAEHQVTDPFAPDSPLMINTGCLTGTAYMTGLRAYFTGYSPLKRTKQGAPMASWSAMSGCFGRKFRASGIDDLILIGAASTPKILLVKQTASGPEVSLLPAPEEIAGARTPVKFEYLNKRFNKPEARDFPAHFAVLGPAGEHWQTVWYASIAGSTTEQLQSGEDKMRFAGRLGMGSVLGSKGIIAIVAYAEEDLSLKGDERMKPVNREIGRGEQSKNYRHPDNRDGRGGTGRNERLLDGFGILPFRNFEPRGENLATPTHLETTREANHYIVIDKNCFGCQISCHQDVYAAPEGGKDPNPRAARRNHGPYVGRYEFEPMELSGPNNGVLDLGKNLELARLADDLGFDAISVNVVLSFLMDYNSRNGKRLAGDLQFGDAEGAVQVMEDIAYGREPLFGKGVKAISEAVGGAGFAMHSKGVELSAYLGQTNPGYPFATAGGHMSMRTFLLYATDPDCKPESADYWVDKIANEGWKMINVNLHGGCLFAMAPPNQVAQSVESIYGIPMTAERILGATYQAHLMGFALEQRQGATAADYDLPEEVFVGGKKGDLPGVHFLTRELFEEIRERVLSKFTGDAVKYGYLE